SNQINYKAIINPNIETSMIKVPSLILQPFLENALWHGLSTKEGDKSIVLEVEKTASDFVTIKITDNGVGRAASRKIESNKSLNRKSVGIALTMERLANFSKNFSTSYRLNIIDLKDDQGNAMGTQVIIDIPVEQLRLKTA
ncbi:MAG TPA: sensor histidine kinase, partial [Mangrovimonas sp.]|nr:sensor histidine kinase [Mangrovimonas sp.]